MWVFGKVEQSLWTDFLEFLKTEDAGKEIGKLIVFETNSC